MLVSDVPTLSLVIYKGVKICTVDRRLCKNGRFSMKIFVCMNKIAFLCSRIFG